MDLGVYIIVHCGRWGGSITKRQTAQNQNVANTGSPYRSFLLDIENVEVLSALEVRVVLEQPSASFLANLTFAPIVPQDFENKVGNPQTETLGTGPFTLAEFGTDFVRLERYDSYWQLDDQGNRLPYLDAVVFKVVPDVATVRAAMAAGELDFAWGFAVDYITYEQLKDGPNTEALRVPQLGWGTIGFNCGTPPFNDARVRQAVSLAIDRQELVDLAYFGLGTAGRPIPPALEDWAPLPPEALPYHLVDIERAKNLLADAGYPDGFTLNFMPIPTISEALIMSEIIEEQLAQIDIIVQIEQVDFATFVHRWRESEFEAFLSVNRGEIDPSLYLDSYFASDGSRSILQYEDRAIDLLLEVGHLVVDHETRVDIYTALQRRLADQAPALFLSYADMLIVKNRAAHGITLLPNNYLDVKRAWIE